MKIRWVTIKVKNLEKSKAFYEDYLGLELVRLFSPNAEMNIVFYTDKNGMQIELIEELDNEKLNYDSNYISIGIQPENYDELFFKAKQMNILNSESLDLGEIECFFVKDPNNLSIQIFKEKIK
ncbi:MAG: VOC family protein [Tissierellia bacterium]|jgi:catechol 2,3-dioxygenase-like lactoylglutathione lyase family enzyme|nr:VOC family protein [Tissierellia bacterium]